ncbi:MAG: glutamine synthetase [Wolbachia endosymbiont of Fragariocoptes setiger]|nr:glutamine synthetase [Wolbachia endosymbiont of Fragariocoptes setiger]
MTYKYLKKTLLIWGIELEFYVEGIECDLFLHNVQKKISWFKFYCEKETSINQYEIKSCCYDNFNVLTKHFKCVKEILTETSHSLGGHISFHAKPYLNRAGSALNVHVNLIDLNSNNLFYISNNKCSDYLFYSVGGLCFVMKKYMQYFAPNNESYLRFKYPDIHTPTTISWGVNNRTAAIRIIPHPICRLEHRIPGADCDLREVLEAIVEGISFGIENKIAPPKRVYGIASDPQYKMEKLI